jgi:hypothetical protein
MPEYSLVIPLLLSLVRFGRAAHDPVVSTWHVVWCTLFGQRFMMHAARRVAYAVGSTVVAQCWLLQAQR